ncbi:LON peptidase substrate-binding domain-containing protein [Achromobacter arsenitoxydans]|uniref:ATP-dependent protease La (LON) domain-containing protein n=1 Tax=Achromobacter arsenitoxydans SY8 TaxID=477184 RepID=H0FBU2_9BURK|nr:LON peptidase substrate-binding domain-containing protein [Achromobacter arsenitoxydans]EHK64218.1 ATP-dependent protease La (LON) domain-containing protein [Achromobacter arsenitoxydans SY8]
MSLIPLFPLSNALFPGGVAHLRIFEVRYLDMIRRSIAQGTEFGIVGLLAGSEVRSPEGVETLAPVGTMARIDAWEAPMPALLEIRCTGTGRFRLLSSEVAKYGLWMGEAEPIPDDPPTPVPAAMQASADALGRLVAQWQQDGVPPERMPLAPPFRLDDCGWVANRWCELLPLPPDDKADLLALADPVARLASVQDVLRGQGLA